MQQKVIKQASLPHHLTDGPPLPNLAIFQNLWITEEAFRLLFPAKDFTILDSLLARYENRDYGSCRESDRANIFRDRVGAYEIDNQRVLVIGRNSSIEVMIAHEYQGISMGRIRLFALSDHICQNTPSN